MRLFLISGLFSLLAWGSLAQSTDKRTKSTTYSASSEWQKITISPPAPVPTAPTPVVTQSASAPPVTTTSAPGKPSGATNATTPTTTDYHPAFTADFATNRNAWKAGNRGDYNYQIGLGRYSVRKRKTDTRQTAFSTVELPSNIVLNHADLFTIKADVLADSGQVPSGGIVFGVKDSLNYSAFTLNNKGEIAILRVANGEPVSDYMSGDYFAPGVPVDKNYDRLTIRRIGEELHFYVNEREVRSSPYEFKTLAGNGIGVTASGYWTSFQKLSVTLGSGSTEGTAPPARVPDKVIPTPAQPETKAPVATPAPTTKTGNAATVSFSDAFERNTHGWLVGKRNGYEFEVAKGAYYVRRLPGATQEAGRTYINLPETVHLNHAESFTISVEMTAPPGQAVEGGLLMGVKDVNNLRQFSIGADNKVIIKALFEGKAVTNYMPGTLSPAGVPIDASRNTLTVIRNEKKLHFYINGQEVMGSPYDFRPFGGNGVGFIAGTTDVKFQNLLVITQPSPR